MILTEAEGRCIPQCEQLEFIPCGQELQNINSKTNLERRLGLPIRDKRPCISHSQSQGALLTRKLLRSKKGSDAKLPVVLFPGIHPG